MKPQQNHRFIKFVFKFLVALLLTPLASLVNAQTFTTLHSFTRGSDGGNPYAGVVVSGNTLYGTAVDGGSSSNGTVFAVHTDGTGFTNLHTFTAGSGSFPNRTNSDGFLPYAGLVLSSNTLYGTAEFGGSFGSGTVFAVQTDGTDFTNLHSFTAGSGSYPTITNSDGAYPYAGLILSGKTLYGTAQSGGSSGIGTVFKINTDGTGFTNLHSFVAVAGSYPNYINSDGANPTASLLLSSNTLYGTAEFGGSAGSGTIFAVNTNGTNFTNLHGFTANSSFPFTNSDGANPQAGLILSGTTLYGTAAGGGSSNGGTVFKVNTDGMGFTNLHSFTYSDGGEPYDGLILSGNNLYGTVSGDDTSGSGAVFMVNTEGTNFMILYRFANGGDGEFPHAGLILLGDTLYGTAIQGGASGNGTAFSLSFAPQLSITHSGTNIILTWPTNLDGFDYSGFTLQSNMSLVSPVGWGAVSPLPVMLVGKNTVTNTISGIRMFYRLSQ